MFHITAIVNNVSQYRTSRCNNTKLKPFCANLVPCFLSMNEAQVAFSPQCETKHGQQPVITAPKRWRQGDQSILNSRELTDPPPFFFWQRVLCVPGWPQTQLYSKGWPWTPDPDPSASNFWSHQHTPPCQYNGVRKSGIQGHPLLHKDFKSSLGYTQTLSQNKQNSEFYVT